MENEMVRDLRAIAERKKQDENAKLTAIIDGILDRLTPERLAELKSLNEKIKAAKQELADLEKKRK